MVAIETYSSTTVVPGGSDLNTTVVVHTYIRVGPLLEKPRGTREYSSLQYSSRIRVAFSYSRMFGARVPAYLRVTSTRVLAVSPPKTLGMTTFHPLKHVPCAAYRIKSAGNHSW